MNKFKIISFLILTSFSSFSFAGAAERLPEIIEATTTSRYSSATGHNYTVGGVKADNGKLVATVAQRVVVDGSAATVTQKVTIPANDAFYKKTAGFAKGLLRGGAVGVAASLAMQQLLDGVGYVLDPANNQILYTKPDTSNDPCNATSCATSQYLWKRSPLLVTFSSQNGICQAVASQYGQTLTGIGTKNGSFACFTKKADGNADWWAVDRVANPSYNPSAPPPVGSSVSDAEMQDAFSNWFKNNPSSVTDPVATYIYSPKTPTGSVSPVPQNNPSFGQQEITDEMMNNYLENRNAELYANDVAANQAAIRDSLQTETETNPDGTKTETKPNPDGSKTETKTETKTNPDTGEVETTVTETVINPDGSRGESKETVKKTETKPNPEISDLPAACEYFAVLCDWLNWTKENPDTPDEDPLQPQELDIGSLDTGTFQATAGCPADIQVPVSFGGASKSIAISYEPICALAQKWSFIAPLIGFISGAMILIGVGRKGEDGDS